MSKHVTGQQAVRRPAQPSRLAKEHRVKRTYNNGMPPRVVPTRNNTGMSSTKWYALIRTLHAELIASLGGIENVSPQENMLVMRAVTLDVECRRRERLFARAGYIDDDALCVYQTATNSLRRTLESLGLKKRMRDVTPSLSDILRQDQQHQRERQQQHVEDEPASRVEHEESS
jgi:hypothetical protein